MNEKKQGPLTGHWADVAADRILRERGDRDVYVCASGITPSGTVHIGNFREIISVELVVRALGDRGEKALFLYSWDDYDVFRKVPQNMPRQEELEKFLRMPITLVPDVLGEEESYAAYNEKSLERLLPVVGVHPEFRYQARHYGRSDYAEGIKTALDKQELIRRLLNQHRTAPLGEDWQPVSVFCGNCHRDTTRVGERNGDWELSYACDSCGHEEMVDLRKTALVKLPWRVDWPMRWKYEGVDFEPAGKDHHSEGGSFDTARGISREVFGHEPPVTFQYDFVRIKGRGGKISSSTGRVVSLEEVLEIYQPEVLRFLFAGTRPNAEFAISFDLDVLKIVEDYDKIERAYFQKPQEGKKLKKWEKDARVYVLSQVGKVPEVMPYQIPYRHLTTLLQIHGGDEEAVLSGLEGLQPEQKERLACRAVCAWNWVRKYAPEDFRFSLREASQEKPALREDLKEAVRALGELVQTSLGSLSEKEFSSKLYDLMRERGLESGDFFPAVYQTLIQKEKGPRLVSFLHIIGKEKLRALLD